MTNTQNFVVSNAEASGLIIEARALIAAHCWSGPDSHVANRFFGGEPMTRAVAVANALNSIRFQIRYGFMVHPVTIARRALRGWGPGMHAMADAIVAHAVHTDDPGCADDCEDCAQELADGM